MSFKNVSNKKIQELGQFLPIRTSYPVHNIYIINEKMHGLDYWFFILLGDSCHAYGEENQYSTTVPCLQKSLSIYIYNPTYNPNSRILIGLTVLL